MRIARIVIFVGFIIVLGLPLVFQRGGPPATTVDAERLIIITPHNEQIRYEFGRAFDAWHLKHHGRRVNVIFNVPGGTAEIRRMLEAQFTAKIENGDEPGGDADLLFGGGSYEHSKIKEGVEVEIDGEKRMIPISAPVAFETAWLNDVYGENAIGDTTLYDPDNYWFGAALSGFGLVYNRDLLADLNVSEPESWVDLGQPALQGWVALVNPAQSGSITTAFEAILTQRGWATGWRILRRASANARYFSARSLKPPTDVSQGDAAVGVCIDFFGRYESQAMVEAGSAQRVGYIDPAGETVIDPDPISMLRNAPNEVVARRFIEFCLSEEGQALWQFAVTSDVDAMGPTRFELRRLPVRRSIFRDHFDRLIDQVNPYEIARKARYPNGAFRAFIPTIFTAMAMATHDDLRDAWQAIVEHPAYPTNGGIVTADDVSDPVLKAMLQAFDALPSVSGPNGEEFSLHDEAVLGDVKAGWLRGGWADAELWPAEGNPQDVLRRDFTAFFRAQYRQVVKLAEEADALAATGPKRP